ncbi:ABC transporter permease [Enterococcus sp. LJL98]
MKKKALLKTSLREMKDSPTRFLSILGIIFLGVAFFVGIGATGPDMIRSADAYYKDTRLVDLSLYSSLGFSEEDQQQLSEVKQVEEVVLEYVLDLFLSQQNQVIRFFSFDQESSINHLVLTEGAYPKKENEIVFDRMFAETKEYKVGDSFKIEEKDDPENQLKQREYKIVGFVQSPEFIDNSKRGNTNIGNGSIAAFAYLPKENFQMDAFGRALLTFNNVRDQTAYSKEYEAKMEENKETIQRILEPRKQGRLDEIRQIAHKEIEKNQAELTKAEQQIADGEKKLAVALKELEKAEAELTDGRARFQAEITKGQAEIETQSASLREAQKELRLQQAKLNEKQRELDRNSGKLTAYEEQLAQLYEQQAAFEMARLQLEEAQVIYQELLLLFDQMQELTEEEKSQVLLEVQTLLRQLQGLLPNDAGDFEWLERLITEITLENLRETEAGIRELGRLIEQQLTETQALLANLVQQQEELEAGKQAIEAGQAQLDAGRLALEAGQVQLDEAREQLSQGKAQLAVERERGQKQLADGEAAFKEGRATYEQERQAFEQLRDEKLPELKKAQQTLNKEKEKLAELSPASFTVRTREDHPGYLEYEENANRISSIATVFPTIFFLIAALVSLTTMGRMIEEKRVEIGTYKALGYKNGEVAQKFLIYSLAAGLAGTLLGLVVGFYLFPVIIINAYGQLYSMGSFSTPWHLTYALIAFVVGLFCTVGVSLIVLRVDLISNPATLLRPKAPKAGKTILLERIRPLWRRLNFNQKVTMRNLFRYKARMFMTVFGIAGCTAMILTGFGLKNSIGDIVPIQFNEVWRYQGIVTFDTDATEKEEKHYQETRQQLPGIESHLGIASENLMLKQLGKNNQEVTVYVPEEPNRLADFVSFTDRKTKAVYSLEEEGAVINEKLATLFDLRIGDQLTLENSDQETFQLEITNIVENYVGHFAYVTPAYYQKVFGKTPDFNTDLLLFRKELSKETETKIANELMKEKQVLNVTFLSDSSTALDDTTEVLNIVVWVLIISAGLLAFIVLYNLNNINISERIRELSTIKVLGFYNKEVTMYIYRENIFLTIFGITGGLVFGQILHRYVLQTVELDMLMFSPKIHVLSYLYSSIITIFFTIVVGFVMYQKLKKVDMIEALKSND